MQRKKSLPDVATLPTVAVKAGTQVMTREEISVLSSARYIRVCQYYQTQSCEAGPFFTSSGSSSIKKQVFNNVKQIFNNTPHSSLEKIHLFLRICFLNLTLNNVGIKLESEPEPDLPTGSATLTCPYQPHFLLQKFQADNNTQMILSYIPEYSYLIKIYCDKVLSRNCFQFPSAYIEISDGETECRTICREENMCCTVEQFKIKHVPCTTKQLPRSCKPSTGTVCFNI